MYLTLSSSTERLILGPVGKALEQGVSRGTALGVINVAGLSYSAWQFQNSSPSAGEIVK